MVRVFLYSDWIRGDTPYLSVFSPNTGKQGPEITPYLDTFHALYGEYWSLDSLKIFKNHQMVNQRFQSNRTLTLQNFGRPLPNLNILTRVTYLTTFSILLGFFIVLVAILSQKLLDFFNYQFFIFSCFSPISGQFEIQKHWNSSADKATLKSLSHTYNMTLGRRAVLLCTKKTGEQIFLYFDPCFKN